VPILEREEERNAVFFFELKVNVINKNKRSKRFKSDISSKRKCESSKLKVQMVVML